jgi:glucose 1-dehydrogenase
MKLQGKKALVTGAARGIGRGCALELARAGADVAINDRDRSPQAECAVAEIQALGRQAVLVEGDAFARSSCERIVASALAALGRIDILISNPAFSRRGAFLEYDPATFDKVVQGTLHGGFHMSQLVARHMVEGGGGGKIVFISSVHAEIPYARSVAYNAGKSGLNQLALTIAAELARHRINVNVIEPGWIDTPGEHETFGSDAIRHAAPSLPWGRLGTPEDIGKAAVFLSSGDADYITGAILLVDGGFCLRGAMPQPTE